MSDSQKNGSRREFLKIGGLGVLAAVAGQHVLRSTASAQGAAKPAAGAAPKLEMAKESDSMAKALFYVEDAAKADPKKRIARANVDGAKQYCWNCQFYQTTSDKPETVAAAPCTILANKGVKGKGWCNSWTPNPKVKI